MSWECPNCGHKANEKNFCGMCGCARPEETPLSGDDIANDNIESNLVEISKNESAELQTENVVADIPHIDNEKKLGEKEVAEKNTANQEEASPQVECNNYQSTHAAADSVKENSVQGNLSVLTKVGKTKLIGGIAGILMVIFLIIYGFSGSDYQENCADFVAITEELDKTADKIADLPGDATDTERKDVTDALQKHIDKLDKLSKEIKKSEDKQKKNQNNNSDENFYALRQLVDYEITYLQSIKAAVSYSQEDTGDLSNYVSSEYRQIVDDFNNIYPKYYGLADVDIEYKDKKTNKKSIVSGKDMLRWSKLEDVLSTYIHKKNENDGRKLADLKTKANDKIRENNEDLKKKEEVVFLVNNVYAGPNGNIMISGEFYNGTKDNVPNVKEALVDISLKAYDNEVFYTKDEKVIITGSPSMSPGSTSKNVVISVNVNDKLKNGKIPYFTTADVSMHKIRWVVRKLVKR